MVDVSYVSPAKIQTTKDKPMLEEIGHLISFIVKSREQLNGARVTTLLWSCQKPLGFVIEGHNARIRQLCWEHFFVCKPID